MADNKLTCSILDCGNGGRIVRGWCEKHYSRWYKTGNPTGTRPQWPSGTERFWAKVNKTATCWNWAGAPADTGYGRINFRGKDCGAHRVSWEIHRGPIPPGMHIDHRCHNRLCVNPGHLRLATNKQNGENHQGATAASTTGARGVYLDKRRGSYYAQVTHNQERYSTRGFATVEEASAAATALRNLLFTRNDRDRIAA